MIDRMCILFFFSNGKTLARKIIKYTLVKWELWFGYFSNRLMKIGLFTLQHLFSRYLMQIYSKMLGKTILWIIFENRLIEQTSILFSWEVLWWKLSVESEFFLTPTFRFIRNYLNYSRNSVQLCYSNKAFFDDSSMDLFRPHLQINL